jgi:hypothetical protein
MTSAPIPSVERPVYFDGQRLTAEDLSDATGYSRALRELHNRALHGWGVALGLAATGARGARSVRVEPGFALDCAGRELLLAEPCELPVPPTANPSRWLLVISAAPEAEPAERRAGECDTDGAVRLIDAPQVRWLSTTLESKGRVRTGLDVVLADAVVENCRLKLDIDTTVRNELARPQPYVASGRTPAYETHWEEWTDSGAPAGVTTTVSTAEAGFNSLPSYQARLGGSRSTGSDVIDGPVYLAGAGVDEFEFYVDLRGYLAGGTAPSDLPATARDELGWHVVWMAVETR